ncbi:MAG TPA: hypothetical protein VK787_13190 [Puia sp.]|jgi:hypothetical protein|nr:hypothetical protein [Puia sp.]
MKKTFFILIAVVFVSLSYSQSKKNNICIAQTDAEKILGQPAQLTQNSSEVKNGIDQQKCTYTANAKENKISNLYFMFEKYNNAKSAHKAYQNILSQNANMQELKRIENIGDEAFIHTDDANFLMIICRKENKMLRLKVNKLTSTTSIDEMKKTAMKLL